MKQQVIGTVTGITDTDIFMSQVKIGNTYYPRAIMSRKRVPNIDIGHILQVRARARISDKGIQLLGVRQPSCPMHQYDNTVKINMYK